MTTDTRYGVTDSAAASPSKRLYRPSASKPSGRAHPWRWRVAETFDGENFPRFLSIPKLSALLFLVSQDSREPTPWGFYQRQRDDRRARVHRPDRRPRGPLGTALTEDSHATHVDPRQAWPSGNISRSRSKRPLRPTARGSPARICLRARWRTLGWVCCKGSGAPSSDLTGCNRLAGSSAIGHGFLPHFLPQDNTQNVSNMCWVVIFIICMTVSENVHENH